ncbi:MAG: glycosyltransferase family 39 protein, partial [Patescibacteria group bacterium]|nr:glycosyltransferase family 39 protein [Patescibacteria group bacterium]
MFLSKNKKLLLGFLIFSFLNIFLYFFIINFNSKVKFHKFNYLYNAHHFLKDKRAEDGKFNFLRAMGQYDAQWYLKIAENGYPQNPGNINVQDKKIMGGLTYAFFPLYPIFFKAFNSFFKNVELSAFIFSNLFLIINFFSLYFIIVSFYSKKIALRSIFLLFFFPFAIFYRSYFTEGLYLFLLIWFSYFLIKKKYLYSTVFLSILNITKATGFLLNFLLLYFLVKEFKQKKTTLKFFIFQIMILFLPILAWIMFNFNQTGNPFYFISIRSVWVSTFLVAPFINFSTVFLYPILPLHSFHFSELDILIAALTLLLLLKAKRILINELWWISFILFLTPLLVSDFMSFSRYQTVSFPLFI